MNPILLTKRSRLVSPKKSKVIKALDSFQEKRDIQHQEFMVEIQKQHKEVIESEQKKINLLEKLIDKF
ncbi:hypothetical protein SNE40_014372 [Patella caerulea]|uniref:Uncharacterized protein n=1 Tax=Patella caerulea TaxID=87958 RepID=A0AAN8JE96_PATCE